jgi:hypothetical protein
LIEARSNSDTDHSLDTIVRPPMTVDQPKSQGKNLQHPHHATDCIGRSYGTQDSSSSIQYAKHTLPPFEVIAATWILLGDLDAPTAQCRV